MKLCTFALKTLSHLTECDRGLAAIVNK